MGCATSTLTASERDLGAISSELGKNAGKDFHAHFITKSFIGKGTFAQVQLAQDMKSGQDVAVKVLDLRHPPDEDGKRKPGRLDKRVRAAKREVALLNLVSEHPHIVQCHGHFIDEALAYIVMEYCPNTLQQVLTRMPNVTESFYVTMFRQVFQALEFVHSKSIVHRDVKPDNLLVGYDGVGFLMKICDFGLAEIVDTRPGAPLLTSTFGTAPYMSPEMITREGYDTQTDVWSAGVIAYVLMLGHFPYQPSGAPTSEAMKKEIARGVPEPSYKPWLPESVDSKPWISKVGETFLRSVLTRKPSERPTATKALASEWLQRAREPDGEEPSLRPALVGAQHAGAFDFRIKNVSTESKSVERLLRLGQANEGRLRPRTSSKVSSSTVGKQYRRTRTPESGGSTPSTAPSMVARTESTTSDAFQVAFSSGLESGSHSFDRAI